MAQDVPTEILYGEVGSSNTYSVRGRATDGSVHPIRFFSGLKFRADEGMQLYSLTSAQDEARDIAKRNRLSYYTAAPSDYRRLQALKGR